MKSEFETEVYLDVAKCMSKKVVLGCKQAYSTSSGGRGGTFGGRRRTSGTTVRFFLGSRSKNPARSRIAEDFLDDFHLKSIGCRSILVHPEARRNLRLVPVLLPHWFR